MTRGGEEGASARHPQGLKNKLSPDEGRWSREAHGVSIVPETERTVPVLRCSVDEPRDPPFPFNHNELEPVRTRNPLTFWGFTAEMRGSLSEPT